MYKLPYIPKDTPDGYLYVPRVPTVFNMEHLSNSGTVVENPPLMQYPSLSISEIKQQAYIHTIPFKVKDYIITMVAGKTKQGTMLVIM